ncbi:SWEET sugar transporter [Phytophthora cactorum]|nr:SWEET sugar transporter [Phytophthora cactorum]
MVDSSVLWAIKVLAAMTSLMMICSPSISIYRIHKKKDVGVASVIPLVSLLANSHMWMLYGYMVENWFPIFWIFVFGDVVALTFLAVYWRYTTERRYVGPEPHQVGSTLGFISDAVAVCLYGAPMEKLFHVLKYRSAVFINVHMVIAGLSNNCTWITYGILSTNWFIISPNILFISLNSFTLVLYMVFNPKTHPLPNNFVPEGTESAISIELTPKESFSRKVNSELPSPAFEAMQSPLQTLPWATASVFLSNPEGRGCGVRHPLGANSHMWMLYGYMIKNCFPVSWVFLFGDAPACSTCWRYTPERRHVSDSSRPGRHGRCHALHYH